MSVREDVAVVYSMRQVEALLTTTRMVCVYYYNKPLPVSLFLPQGFCIDMVEIT
ncbi:hypothetical protein [Anaplasma phagocytophilum]|uniref:hypothetical protein n=1 Tax=Anaplasma phagocytophilum TaxID=948 RepID=UPI00164A4784|nr:hypothetical protein [Anaplasma phagocytophilum]